MCQVLDEDVVLLNIPLATFAGNINSDGKQTMVIVSFWNLFLYE